MIYPYKKAYSTENIRKEDLKMELRKLCSAYD